MLTAGPLTIKHIENDGHESIAQAVSINYHPGRTGHDGERPSLIAFGVPDAVSGPANNVYDSGVIYVMNESGSTVGRYHLGEPTVQGPLASRMMGGRPLTA